jgi:hypothetical protein
MKSLERYIQKAIHSTEPIKNLVLKFIEEHRSPIKKIDKLEIKLRYVRNLKNAIDMQRQNNRSLIDFINIPEILQYWNPKKQCLFLYGPTGTEKTDLAKSILYSLDKSSLFASNLELLKFFNREEYNSLIFDDIQVKPDISVLGLVDTENLKGLDIRYKTVHIPAFPFKILILNTPEQLFKNVSEESLS